MNDRHGPWLRLAHWTTVSLVAAQCTLAGLNALLYEPRPVLAEALVQAHISLGLLILVLTLARLAIRLGPSGQAAPAVRTGLPGLVGVVHSGLYIVLLLLPVTGYVKLAALGYEIRLFSALSLPALPFDPWLSSLAQVAHVYLSATLGVLVAVHVVGALLHRHLFGSPILSRMAIAGRRSRE